MADVVGSDEGAEAAGAGPGQTEQAGHSDRPAAESGNEVEAGAQASATDADAEVDGDAGTESDGETGTQAADPGAETVPDEAPQDAESAISDPDDAAATEAAEGEAEAEAEEAGEAAEAVAAETVAVETVAVEETAEVEAVEVETVEVETVEVEAVAVQVEATEATEAVAVVEATAAAAAAPPVPPVRTPSAAFVPPGRKPSGDAAGRPLPLGLDRRRALLVGAAAAIVVGGGVAAFAATGGSGGSTNSASGGPGPSAGGKATASSAPPIPAAEISTVPADGATGVDPSKPITVRVHGGTIDSVALSGQDQTNGTLSTDRSSWTSANVLSVDSHYSLTITAKNSAGKSTTSAVSFRTLTPSATFGVSEVVPPRGSTVGVGQPIRVTFTNYVPAEYKASLEKACVVTTSPPVAGAWYWVSNGSDGAVVDWRPKDFWPVNTKVTINFSLDGVRLGQHQFGVEDYKPHEFTISDRDLRLIVDKDEFRATCYENGKVIKTFPIDTGVTSAETFVTYTGTMSVLGKGNPVEMKGNYGPGDTYDDFVNWATQITWSGTYVHAAEWDPDIGRGNDDSHGCVHCHAADAEWFYNKVISGDVVTINGKRERPVDVGNGICTFTLDWKSVLKGSAYGATLNGRPVSA